MIDVVYVLGKGSIWYNNELRFSLRSVEKHLSGVRDVYIIGECPSFITNAKWIPMKDSYKKERNIMEKLKIACEHPDISEEFLFINDDHFFLKAANADTYPYYFCEPLVEAVKKRRQESTYTKAMWNTLEALQANGFTEHLKNFDIHTPIRYNKQAFIESMKLVDWENPGEYIIKSLYCNSNKIIGCFMPDRKIQKHLDRADIETFLQGAEIFSIADIAINDWMIAYFKELYPNRSKWENS